MNEFMAGIDTVSELGSQGLVWAIDAGCYAGLLAVVVLLANVLFRRWLSAGQKGLLWGLVLVRLLVPVAPESTMSLQNLVRPNEAETSPPLGAMVLLGAAAEREAAALPSGPYSDTAAQDATSFAEGALEAICNLLPILWLVTGASILAWTAIIQWHFSRRVGRTEACRDARLTELWTSACRLAGVREVFPIIVFEGVAQPAVMGLVRPRLLLPASALELADDQLRMIMLHELAHVRRFDIAVNWLLVLVQAAQWWNPVYWLAASRFASLREQACDAFVIRRSAAPSSRGYSELLLALAERAPACGSWRVMLPVSILGIVSSYSQRLAVRNRLRALHTAGKDRGRWQTAVGALAIALAASCGLTDAKTPIEPAEQTDWLPRATIDRGTWNTVVEAQPGPLQTRVYDLEKARAQIAAGRRGSWQQQVDMEIDFQVENALRALRPAVSLNAASPAAIPSAPAASVDLKKFYTRDGTRLTVQATREIHEELSRSILTWEESGLGQITIECRFISGLRDCGSAVGLAWRYPGTSSPDPADELTSQTDATAPVVRASMVVNDHLPVAVASLNPRQAEQLIQTSQGERRTNVLYAPKITMFSGQRASIVDCKQTPFVVGIREIRAGVQEPNIAVYEEGTKISLRATNTADRRQVRLQARLEVSQIGDVHTAATAAGPDAASIQLPRVKSCRVDVASTVEDGHSVLIGCIPSYEEKRIIYVLLTARNIIENDEGN